MILVFGDFLEPLPHRVNSAMINFSLSYGLIDQQNSGNHLSFGSITLNMLKMILSQYSEQLARVANKLESSVDYIVNELLENSVKYGDRHSPKVDLEIYVNKESVIIKSTNLVSEYRSNVLKSYINEITNSDISELYLRRLEENVHNNQESGLGFLSIIHDYEAKIGWKLKSLEHQNEVLSSVMVQFSIS